MREISEEAARDLAVGLDTAAALLLPQIEIMAAELNRPHPWLEAMTRPAPGYREIANKDGIRWHERIEPDAEDPAT